MGRHALLVWAVCVPSRCSSQGKSLFDHLLLRMQWPAVQGLQKAQLVQMYLYASKRGGGYPRYARRLPQ